MAEAIALDYSQLVGCENVYEAALQWAEQHQKAATRLKEATRPMVATRLTEKRHMLQL